MLRGFTWEQFFGCWAVLSLLWYGMVLLVWYPGGIRSFFGGNAVALSGGSDGSEAGKPVAVAVKDEEDSGAEGLMGRPALPQGMSVVGMGELGFVRSDDDGADRYGQVGLVADVVQELKMIFAQLASEVGEKRDFFRLLEVVKERYGKIGGHPSIGAINAFVVSNVPFLLSGEELENLWD